MRTTISILFALMAIIGISAKDLSRIHVEGNNFVDEEVSSKLTFPTLK